MLMDVKVKPHRALGGRAHLWTVVDITDAEIRYSNSSPLKLRHEVLPCRSSLSKEKFQKGAGFRRSNSRQYRRSRAKFCERWALRFSGFRATSQTTKSTAYTWPPMKTWYVSMPSRAVFRPTESREFGR